MNTRINNILVSINPSAESGSWTWVAFVPFGPLVGEAVSEESAYEAAELALEELEARAA